MYSVFCAVAIFFVIFVVPETKGRDLDSIAKLFIKNRHESMKSISNGDEKRSTNKSIAFNVIESTNNSKPEHTLKSQASEINSNVSEITRF